MIYNILEFFAGYGIGYSYVEDKREEDEVKQGKNYYFASLEQADQISSLSEVIYKINHLLKFNPLRLPISLFCNIAPFAVYPLTLAIASVKHENYEILATKFNEINFFHLPTNLSQKTISRINFLAEHLGDMIRVAMIVSAFAIIKLGCVFYGVAFLAALAYEAAHRRNLISHRVHLWMETYMPTIADAGLVMGGTLFSQVKGIYYLMTHSPFIKKTIEYKFDAKIREYFNIDGPTLEKICETPIQENKNLTYSEIKEILDLKYGDFEVDSSHFTKWVVDPSELPQDNNYQLFLQHFDSIDWKNKFNLVIKKLKTDDRFIDFVYNQLEIKDEGQEIIIPDNVRQQLAQVAKQRGKDLNQLLERFKEQQKKNSKKADIEENLGLYVLQLAQKQKLEPNVYLANWLREQMAILVDYLEGNRPVVGHQSDLEEAKTTLRCILPYLTALKSNNSIEFEDILLKLSVEGGDYCALGTKRTANELMDTIILDWIEKHFQHDPIKKYEHILRQSLQKLRFDLVKEMYGMAAHGLAPKNSVVSKIMSDEHAFSEYRYFISLGFTPFTYYQKKEKGIIHLAIWEFIHYLLSDLLNETYKNRLNEVKEERSSLDYLSWILKNLSEGQQKEIMQRNNDELTRLLFYSLGILKKRNQNHPIIPIKIDQKVNKIVTYFGFNPIAFSKEESML